MKTVTFTILYEDLAIILDVMGDWLKNEKIKKENSKSWSKEEELYFQLIDLWGANASKEISSEFDAYTRQDDYDLPNEYFNILIICAFRYALRFSHLPALVSDMILSNENCLTNKTINTIIEEIETTSNYGGENEKEIWNDLKDELKEFLKERK